MSAASPNAVRDALGRIASAFAKSAREPQDDLARLAARVKDMPLLADCHAACVRTILAEADWLCLPGGTELDRDGENDRAVFLVLSGSLGVFVDDGRGGGRLVALIPAGETVGEMSLISGDAHAARLVAMRDAELLRLAKPAFDRLIAREPQVMMNLVRLVIRRLRATTSRAAHAAAPKTFALAPGHDGPHAEQAARALADAFGAMGLRIAYFDARHRDLGPEHRQQAEAANDLVLYCGDAPGSAWTQACLRQADRVLVLARAGEAMRPLGGARHAPELVLLHPEDARPSRPDGVSADRHHHVRLGRGGDVARLARLLTGRATSLVLAGGGARGFAHLGAIKALREAGVAIDQVAGASMGAVVAAGVAMEWEDAELSARMRDAFVDTNPIDDWTLPIVSLFRGAKVERLLRRHFGDARIEDLPVPFVCLTSDLTVGASHAHREGALWKALKASTAIPGLLAPVVYGGHLHVDGGIMNNLPVDVLAEDRRGPIVAVDVGGDSGLTVSDERYGDESWFARLRRRRRKEPGLVHILMRTGTVGNETQRRLARAQADLVIDPELDGIGLTSWRKFDRAVEAGYRATAQAIETGGLAGLKAA